MSVQFRAVFASENKIGGEQLNIRGSEKDRVHSVKIRGLVFKALSLLVKEKKVCF